jgi:uncharacterized protein DUF5309
MALDTIGILSVIDFSPEQINVINEVEREYFVNEHPLFSRLPHRPATSETYTILSYDARITSSLVATGGISSSATSLPITDASPFMQGDILELVDAATLAVIERVEVSANPTAAQIASSPNTLTVKRGLEGTSGTAYLAADIVRLIGNSRTGAEIDQQAYRPTTTSLLQNVQTVQYPVQIGGKAEAITNIVLPPGASSIMGRDRAIKLLDATREIERSMLYGLGETPAANGDRAKMKGLKTLIKTYNSGGNVTTAAGASVTKTQFLAATVNKIYGQGGMADVVLCSQDFLGFLDTWVPTKTAVMGVGKTNELGFPINTFVLPLNAMPLTFIVEPQMRSGTAAVLSSNDLDVRFLRELFWLPREKRGDATEGDWIGDFAINMGHPKFHAWFEGMTSAA